MTEINILQFLSSGAILTVLQLTLGKYLKGKVDFPNKVIPWVSLALAIVGYTVAPGTANAAASIPLAPAAGIFLSAAFHTLFTTGIHSFGKNALLPALTYGLRSAAISLLSKEDK
jgi:hypothetical protein